MKKTDIAIVGAGPVGLFMVFEAGMLGYKCTLLDSLDQIGGQLTELYPEKPIYDIPGFPSILAKDIVEQLRLQAEPFSPEYMLGNPVEEVERQEDGSFNIKSGDDTLNAKVIVIAGGAGVFTPRKPPLANLEEYEKKSVFYSVKNKEQFADKTLVIAGGGDSAADWAVELAPKAKHVHVVHRRNTFRAADETVRQMEELQKAGKITIHAPSQLGGLEGTDGMIEKVVLKDLEKNESTVDADYLLCFYGLSPSLGKIADWGLNTTTKKVIVQADTMETNVDGILGIGDITEYPGKLDLILTGFAESAIAAKTAQGIIEPEKKFKLIYTTSQGLPESA